MDTWREKIIWFDYIQEQLKKFIDLGNRLKKVKYIAGADVAYKGNLAKSCVCVMEMNTLKLVEKKSYQVETMFPYIPGYLFLREGPPILGAIAKLNTVPDCFMFDGNGILHPKNLGLATFLGMILKKPAIGCSKNLLLGSYIKPPLKRGEFSYIKHKGKVLGAALRTKTGVKEIFVSCGWGINLKNAINIVLLTSGKYRVPQPLRLAHMEAKI